MERASTPLAAGAARRPDGRPARSRRERHGRTPRGPLLPSQVPAFRTRAELFDTAVLDVVADLSARWPGQVPRIEIAVDDVPPATRGELLSSADAVRDGPVVLTRFLPAGVDAKGRPTKARIVLYRRPIEMRCPTPADVLDAVTELLVEQLTAVLGEGDG